MKKNINVMITAFRDGFQSIYGARVLTKDFIPALKAVADTGATHFEAGGGARFQSLFFYCNENAFDMMDAFRETVGPNANLQTLARGVNVVALDSQPKDIISLHAKLFKKHGMTTIRNFDALNDVNNLKYSGQAITDAGLKHEICITMMSLPPKLTGAHDPLFYIKTLDEIIKAKIPFDSLCFKDASGTATPAVIHQTISTIRKKIPATTKIAFHTHDTAGTGIVCYMAALDAGADQIDLSLAPVSGGTSQPDVISMWHALRGTNYELNIDVDKILIAEEVCKDTLKDYFVPPEAKAVEPLIPWSPMPGGALTANTQMMRDNNILDRYPEIISAMREVVEKGGFGTSVTPVSQFYFQQAFNNVMLGKWKKFSEGYAKMILGYFGKTPVKPDPEIVELASKQLNLKTTTKSPIDLDEENPKKGINATKKILEKEKIKTTDENIFIVASCGQKGIDFLKGKAKVNIRKNTINKEKKIQKSPPKTHYTVNINNKDYIVNVSEKTATVDGKSFNYTINETKDNQNIVKPNVENINKNIANNKNAHFITAPMPGTILSIHKKPKDKIEKDETIFTLEAMKMEMNINATKSGKISQIFIQKGEQITPDQNLAEITDTI